MAVGLLPGSSLTNADFTGLMQALQRPLQPTLIWLYKYLLVVHLSLLQAFLQTFGHIKNRGGKPHFTLEIKKIRSKYT